MIVDNSFPHKYEMNMITELNCGHIVYYFPEASIKGGKDGIIVEIIPEHGESWIGVFAFGTQNQTGFSGVFTMPDPNKLCVVSKGKGYLVNVNDPKYCEIIDAIPIIDVHAIPTKNIVVFADYTKLVAYDETKIKWKTKRLAWDGFKIIMASEECIKGKYYDLRSEGDEFFEVNLSTGEHIGGIE